MKAARTTGAGVGAGSSAAAGGMAGPGFRESPHSLDDGGAEYCQAWGRYRDQRLQSDVNMTESQTPEVQQRVQVTREWVTSLGLVL